MELTESIIYHLLLERLVVYDTKEFWYNESTSPVDTLTIPLNENIKYKFSLTNSLFFLYFFLVLS